MDRPVRHRTEAEKFLEYLGYGLLQCPIQVNRAPLFHIFTITKPERVRPKFHREFPPGMSPAQIQEVMHSRTFSNKLP